MIQRLGMKRRSKSILTLAIESKELQDDVPLDNSPGHYPVNKMPQSFKSKTKRNHKLAECTNTMSHSFIGVAKNK